jgi:hypothetical protein
MGNIPVSKEVTREKISRSMIKHHRKNKSAQESLMELEQAVVEVEEQVKVHSEIDDLLELCTNANGDFEF